MYMWTIHQTLSTYRCTSRLQKTDSFRQGVSVHVYFGSTNRDVCLVAAVVAYMVLRRQTPGAFADRRPMACERKVAAARAAPREAAIDDSKYSGHSFRIEAATTAAQQGIPDSLIKKHWVVRRVQHI